MHVKIINDAISLEELIQFLNSKFKNIDQMESELICRCLDFAFLKSVTLQVNQDNTILIFE